MVSMVVMGLGASLALGEDVQLYPSQGQAGLGGGLSALVWIREEAG